MGNFKILSLCFILGILALRAESQSCDGGKRKSQFVARSLPLVCGSRCRFGVGYAGFHIGYRYRTVYRCCNGEEPVLESLFFNLFSCPQPQNTSNNAATSPGNSSPSATTLSSTSSPPSTDSASVQPSSSTLSVQETPSEQTSSSVQQSSTATLSQQSSSSTSSVQQFSTTTLSEQESPSSVSTQLPTSSPATDGPKKGCPFGARRRKSFFETQENVCKYLCSFGVRVQGQPAGRRTRKVYSCCDGSRPKLVNAFYQTMSCEN